MIYAIDPGASKPSALAIINQGVCIYYGDCSNNIKEIIAAFSNKLSPDPPELVVVEGQYLGPNAKTLIQLAEMRGRYLAAAEYCEIPTQIVQPQQWMTAIGLKSNTKRSTARDNTVKALAKASIKNLNPGKEFNIDHAAAVHIGFYAYSRWDFKRKVMRNG